MGFKEYQMNLNVLLQNMGANQLSYLVIRNLNRLAETQPNIDSIVYYEDVHRPCILPTFAVMQIAEAWCSQNPLIATSLSTAHKLMGFPNRNKFFYIWELEWLRHQPRMYEQYAGVYTDPSLTLICRSESHKKLVENTFNREVQYIVEDFDTDQMLEILNENKTTRPA